MMIKTKLLSTIISLLLFIGFSQAQNHTFIALDNAGNLYEVNTDSCKSTKLTLCTNYVVTKGVTDQPLSIGMDGNLLYIVDNNGYLYSNTLGPNGTTGNCVNLGQFKSKSTAIYGMTVGPGGKVYAASGSLIETYTPKTATTGTFGTLGSLPTKWTIGGDLLFYKGNLYEAVNINGSKTNNALIMVDTTNPALSSLYLNFNAGTSVFGFASVTVPCSNNQAYALSTGTTTTDIYAVDMISKTQSTTATCVLPYKVNDAASVAETQSATPPVAPTVVSPVNYCQNDPVSLLSATVASNMDTLKWYTVPVNGTATGKPVPTVSSATIGTVKYYVSDFDTSTKCESTRDSIIVTVSAYPAVPVVSPVGPDTICSGSNLLFTSTALASNINQWYQNGGSVSGANNTSYTANTGGAYTIKTSTAAGCSKTSVASLLGITKASINYPGSPFCPAGIKAVVFSGDTGGRYTVTPVGLVIDSITGILNLASSISGTYTVTYTVGPAHCPFTTSLSVLAQGAGISYSKPVYCKSEGNQTVIFAAGSTTGGTFSSLPSGLSISANGTINPSASTVGSYQVSYTYGTTGVACGVMTATDSVSIADVPVVPAIAGLNKICTGSSITLTNSLAGGVWSSSNKTYASVDPSTGVVTAIAAGNVNIIYSVTNNCGTSTQSQPVVITNGPVTPPITGAGSVCVNQSITLSNINSGGTWTSSDNTIATVNSSGNVTGITSGNIVITYSFTNSCGISSQTQPVAVIAVPVVGVIAGNDSVCGNANTLLTDTTAGGIWTSNNPSATINSSGLVTGGNSGTATISYAVTNTCGTTTQTKKIFINDVPSVNNITGNNTVCANSTVQLSDNTTGGVWTSSNPLFATVNNSGLVTGVASGAAVVSYAVTNTCGTTTKTYNITINDVPVVGAVTGNDSVCSGSPVQLSDAITGGIWTSSNPAAAVVSNTGLVAGTGIGNTTISYALTNTCGTTTQTKLMNANTIPVVSLISGNNMVCVNSTVQLAETTTGGIWTSSNAAVATISNTGLVSGITSDTLYISYAVTNNCGTSTTSYYVRVIDVPVVSAITGNNSVCSGSPVQLSDVTTGGIWISSNPAAATVSNTGLVSGVGVGNTTISYALNNVCGTTTQTKLIYANSIPIVSPVTGNNAVCVNSTIQLSDNTSGGTWSSSNPSSAIINNNGLLIGIATGTTTISYSVTNTCGTTTQSTVITTNDIPLVNNITGNNSVCANASTQLSDITLGGTWSSSNLSFATVGNSGLVTGIALGTSTISYSVTNSCGTTAQTYIISINDVPPITGIIGNNTVCINKVSQLTDITLGGVWSSSNISVAPVSIDGLVSGIANGTAIINYSVTNTCGTSTKSFNVSVISPPTHNPINGTNALCANSTSALSNLTGGGIWTSSNIAVATVNSLGIVTGVSNGSASIIYTVSNTCGTDVSMHPVTIYPIPNSAFLTDPSVPTVCVGNPITFSDNSIGTTVFKSVWYFGNNSLDTGLTVTYTYPDASTYWVTHKIVDQNGCISFSSAILVTVDTLPVVTMPHLVYVLQKDSTTFNPIVNGLDYNATTIWTPDIYLSNNNILNPVCTPVNDITYTLSVTSSIGCKGSDTIKVIVLGMDGIPNIFTPNGDGVHDIWDIPALHKYPTVKLKVFDRNGHLIYSCNDNFKGWDGKYNGQDVPIGTYWYMIDRGFHLPVLSGSVTLIR